ncbi:hypothetical protein GCM10009846_29800 [Agrococcus versicolor]|uniref:Gram-positive cocci surface proteins LPxTG domain-containing protein n=1 Tax=Agrococcus versicolor TaxID=501482 RepID=A0ABN3AYP0_9MICO
MAPRPRSLRASALLPASAALALVAGLVLAPATGASTASAAAVVCPPTAALWVAGPDRALVQVDPADGTELRRLAVEAIYTDIAWSADGIALYGLTFSTIDTLDPATGAVIRSLPMARGGNWNGLTALTDGRLLASGNATNEVVAVDPATGALETVLRMPEGATSKGDLLQLADGDVLGAFFVPAMGGQQFPGTTMLRLDLDAFTVSQAGSVEAEVYGLAQVGDVTYALLSDGTLGTIDVPPTTSGAVIAFEPVGSVTAGQSYGASFAPTGFACGAPTAAPVSTTIQAGEVARLTPLAGTDAADDAFPIDPASLTLLTPGTGTPTDRIEIAEQGVVALAEDGTVSFTPAAGFIGRVDQVRFEVADTLGNVASSTIDVLVLGDAPVANDDAVTTPFETTVAIDVLANDVSGEPGPSETPAPPTEADAPTADPSELTVAIVDLPDEGSVEVADDGTLTYAPAAGFSGIDVLSYEITGRDGQTDVADVTITVAAPSAPPTAPAPSVPAAPDAPAPTTPAASTPTGGLPVTGGAAALPLLLAGLGLALVGVGAVAVRRRRA